MGKTPDAATAADELRELVRDAHAATKDLRQALRESQAYVDGQIKDQIEHAMGEEVRAGLAEYRTLVNRKIADAEDAVQQRFGRMIAAVLGEDKELPMEEMLRRIRGRQQLLETRLTAAAKILEQRLNDPAAREAAVALTGYEDGPGKPG